MVAFVKSGAEIIDFLRKRAFDPSRPVGQLSSFCKAGQRVEKQNKQAADSPLDIVATATSDDIDLDKEVVLPDGGDWSYFTTNGSVFLDHSYSTMNKVAVFRSLARIGNGWLSRNTLLPDSTPGDCVRMVRTLAENGGIGMSIGFEVVESGNPTAEEALKYPGAEFIIRKWLGIEISYTAMPCNVACRSLKLIYGNDDVEQRAARTAEILTKARIPDAVWGKMGLNVAKPKPRRVIAAYSAA